MEHLRVLQPAAGVYAFYDGRSRAIGSTTKRTGSTTAPCRSGSRATPSSRAKLSCTTRTSRSITDAGFRAVLEGVGARTFTVVLSHWHLDHVAGTEAFGDCDVIACERTAELLAASREAIETGSLEDTARDRSTRAADHDVQRPRELSLASCSWSSSTRTSTATTRRSSGGRNESSFSAATRWKTP